MNEKGQGQISTRRVACHHDLAWRQALGEQPLIGSHRIFDPSREWVLGSETVVDEKRAGFGGDGSIAGKCSMADDRAGDERSAVDEEDGARGLSAFRDDPLGRDPTSRDRLAVDWANRPT